MSSLKENLKVRRIVSQELHLRSAPRWAERQKTDEDRRGDCVITAPTTHDGWKLTFKDSAFSFFCCFFLSLYDTVTYHRATSVTLFQDFSSPVHRIYRLCKMFVTKFRR